MKTTITRSLILSFPFTLFAGAAFASSAPLTRVCTELEHLSPVRCVDHAGTFYADKGQLFSWTQFAPNSDPRSVVIHWFIDGVELWKKEIVAKAPSWRAHTSLQIPEGQHRIHLQVQSPNGETLGDFEIATAEQGQDHGVVLQSLAAAPAPAVAAPAPAPIAAPVGTPVSDLQKAPAPEPLMSEEPVHGPSVSRWILGQFQLGGIAALQRGYNSYSGVAQWMPEYRLSERVSIGLDLGFSAFKRSTGGDFLVSEYGATLGFQLGHGWEALIIAGAQTWSTDDYGTAFMVGAELRYHFRLHSFFDSLYVAYTPAFYFDTTHELSAGFGLRF
jgi:hypothetical protein